MKASISFLLLLLCLTLTNCKPNEKHAAKFTLEGAISGQDSGIIVLGYMSDSIVKYDTTRIVHGKFTFTGEIIEPTKAQLNGGNSLNNLPIYLEPGMMKIALVKDKFEVGKMTGSKAQLELDQLKELLRPLDIKFDLLRGQTDKIADSLKNATNDSIKHQLEKRTEEIDKQLSKIREDLNSTYLRFILDHPKSYVSSEYLEMLGANEIITLDSLKLIFNKLDITIQSSKYGKYITNDIRKKENSSIGAMAPDFKAIDVLTNRPVTYFEFKGKNVVLIDFWASWCGPCRMAFPHLKDVYKKYHSKGFEIIAASCDVDKKAWLSAIKQDSTEIWHQVHYTYSRIAKYTKDDIYQNYFVQGIPLQLLVNRDGKIIGRWVGYSSENEKELEEKLAELFK